MLKHFFLFFAFSLLLITEARAQVHFGVQTDLGISYNRGRVEADSLKNFSAVARFLPGASLFLELAPSERYHFTIALGYQPRNLIYSIDRVPKGEAGVVRQREAQRLQYLNLALGLKLLTDDLFPSGRLYFSFEPILAVRIHQRTGQEDIPPSSERLSGKAGFGDVSLRLTAGLEYDIGVQTTLFGGIGYERGFVNLEGKKKPASFPQESIFRIKNDRFNISLGVKF